MLEYLEERGFRTARSGISFILEWSGSCTEGERQTVMDFLEERDLYYSDADAIKKNSREITSETLRKMMPLPIFLTLLSAILTLCFSILFLHGKADLILTFYLCGCSKKNGYKIMALSLGLNGALATLANLVMLAIWPRGVRGRSFYIENFIIDHTAYIFLICWWLLLLFLSVFAAFLIYRQKSCASIRRKVDI